MRLESFQLIRNVGQFDSVNSGAQFTLSRLALIYAENGRGKTTLSSIMRSAANGNPDTITERHRLGAPHAPHVVLSPQSGAPLVFRNGAWSNKLPGTAVFDDQFVAQNVCAGIDIDASHRQNLHELILGAQGVALNAALQSKVAQIEVHNRTLRTLSEGIPPEARGTMSADEFCSLAARADIDADIQQAERNLAAANAADSVRLAAPFDPLTLPDFDTVAVNALLGRTLQDLDAAAAAHVQAHLNTLGRNGAAWVGDGMHAIAGVSAAKDHEICPFCAQDLAGSPLLAHYRAYFSATYEELKRDIEHQVRELPITHGGAAALVFERGVSEAERRRTFWNAFLPVPHVGVDTVVTVGLWVAAQQAVAQVLAAKQAAPLEPMSLPESALTAIGAYETAKAAIAVRSDALMSCNATIQLVKERTASANVSILTADLTRLQKTKARHAGAVASSCAAYEAERSAKVQTEAARVRARTALDNYRQNIFPAYQGLINDYLSRFNAGFRLDQVASANTRGGSSCSYNVLINNNPVPQTAASGPSFRNTLSAGDRNALALAFFFASLEQDPQLAEKIVVIDDPMTSLDEHRSLTTVQEMRRLLPKVAQLIVLSHSKPFLCNLWEGAAAADRSAVRLIREATGSTFAAWDVRQDAITEHDRRHALVTQYLQAADPAIERRVAEALRPILEAFARVAFPAAFQPGGLLGPFIMQCEQRVGTTAEILGTADITELRALLDYANQFHHDSNAAWATQHIKDQALLNFARRTLAFARR